MVPRSFFLVLLVLAVCMLLVSSLYLDAPEIRPTQWVGEPFQVGVLGLAGASALGVLRPRRRLLAVACVLAVVVAVAGMFALGRRDGGDDGGGIGWLLLVMPLAGLAAAFGFAFAGYVFGRRRPVS